MRLFRSYLRPRPARCAENGVRLSVIGRRDRLRPGLVRGHRGGRGEHGAARDRFRLRIAVDYSARDSILRAAARLRGDGGALPRGLRPPAGRPARRGWLAPDVDLLIRTGGEQRLSDFLLWECAYAELVFTDRMWPDFSAVDLGEAVREFDRRERRFGAVPETEKRKGGLAAAPQLSLVEASS